MCDVGETSVLPSGGTSAVLAKLRCGNNDDQQQQQQQQQPLSPRSGVREKNGDSSATGSPSRSRPGTPNGLGRAPSLEKCFNDSEFFRKQRQRQQQKLLTNGPPSRHDPTERPASIEPGEIGNNSNNHEQRDFNSNNEVITNGGSGGASRSCESDGPNNGKEIMAPVLGVPPPPPPAPHMGPDGLILPRKPYNPCLTSNSHKDLHRELLFNQKIGKNVLNQKSELQRALERHREMVSRKEAEKNQEESYKNDPRTALQRAIEQRAKHIQLSQQPQPTEPLNPLATARAKLRSRTDSQ